MTDILKYYDYKNIRKHLIPSIMFYKDHRVENNSEIVKIMEEMKILYPLVFCYKVHYLELFPRKKYQYNKYSEVVCYKYGSKVYQVSPFNYDDLHRLFKTVYNDCVCNHFRLFNRMLISKKKIHQPIVHELFYLNEPCYPILPINQTYEKIINKLPQYIKSFYNKLNKNNITYLCDHLMNDFPDKSLNDGNEKDNSDLIVFNSERKLNVKSDDILNFINKHKLYFYKSIYCKLPKNFRKQVSKHMKYTNHKYPIIKDVWSENDQFIDFTKNYTNNALIKFKNCKYLKVVERENNNYEKSNIQSIINLNISQNSNPECIQNDKLNFHKTKIEYIPLNIFIKKQALTKNIKLEQDSCKNS